MYLKTRESVQVASATPRTSEQSIHAASQLEAWQFVARTIFIVYSPNDFTYKGMKIRFKKPSHFADGAHILTLAFSKKKPQNPIQTKQSMKQSEQHQVKLLLSHIASRNQEPDQIRSYSTLDCPFPSEAPLWMQDFS